MNAEAIALGLAGLAQPLLQEFVVRNRLEARAAHAFTILASLVLALVATWAAGGFADLKVPRATLADPSPVLGYLAARWAPVYALSQAVWGFLGQPIREKLGTA